ncbi:MAG: hypothetical protein F6K32_11380 [Desertifilum sp. SIO1I2]|nr:hypothetical protein [Desertifilum sp. SIO1I2]
MQLKSLMNRSCLAFSGMIVWVSVATSGMASPASVFVPHLDRIRQSLPSGWVMRLPSVVLLGEPADDGFIERLYVRVQGSSSPPMVNVSLFSCTSGPYPCLVGSFAVDSQGSFNAQRDLAEHQRLGTAYPLGSGVQGYLLEGFAKQPPSPFSTVIWAQDRAVYTASFLASERDNLLKMAASMAQSAPIYPMGAAIPEVPLLPF